MRRAWRLAPLLLALLVVPASAQQKVKEPKRPGINGDKNDARAYYQWGVSQMETYPEDAADAFYWAMRLEPGWADAYYARWVALYLADPDLLVLHWEGDSKTMKSAEVQRNDSLMLRALQLDPFLYEKFQRNMWRHVIEQRVKRRYPNLDQAELEDAVRDYTSTGDAETKAVVAYATGNLPYALQEWAADLPSEKDKSWVHVERGRIFYLLGAYDSAAAEYNTAMKDLRALDKKYLVAVYDSKALHEQSLGMIYEKLNQTDAARESYGRALEEDLSYAPAHIAMSNLDLVKGDTAAALSEMDIASQVAPNDGFLAFQYGRILLFAAHDAESLEQFKRSAKLEPYYAEPHIFMAAIYDNAGYTTEAMAEYTAFVNMAKSQDARVAKAKARLAKMSADSAAHAGPAEAATPPKPPES